MRAVVVGARRTRQGTGPFVVRALRAAGVEVTGVVASSEASAFAAAEEHSASGYSDVRAALRAETPDLVAVCSPHAVHAEHLEAVAEAGCACLCEKPLLGGSPVAARRIVERFDGVLLDVVAQWSALLPAYLRLHPQASLPPATFAMRLGPITVGAPAVVDAAPHALSLLWVLCGPGWIENVQADSASGGGTLDLRFEYHFGSGTTRARLTLVHSPEPPRPAEIAVDGLLARRRVEMPAYRQFLVADDGREVALPDPLALVVADFVERVKREAPTDAPRIVAAETHLETLVRACQAVG